MPSYYDRSYRPIDLMRWANLVEDPDYQRVACTRWHEPDGTLITLSTVWVGLDHGVNGREIFESMVFGGEHDNYCERYATEQDALAGHDRILHEMFMLPKSWVYL